MPAYVKNHTYHVVITGKKAHDLNLNIAKFIKGNTEAIIQNMTFIPYVEGFEAHIFYSDYPPEIKKIYERK